MKFETVAPPQIKAGRKPSVSANDAAAFLAAIRNQRGKHVGNGETFKKESEARNRAHAFRRSFGDAKVELRVFIPEGREKTSKPWTFGFAVSK